MRALSRWLLPGVMAVAAAAWAPATLAAVSADTAEIELHAGWYFPDEQGNESLDDLVYGVRFGYNFVERFGMQLDISHFDTEDEFRFDPDGTGGVAPFNAHFEYDQLMADISLEWQVNPDDMAVFQLYGGPGYVWSDSQISGPGFKGDGDFNTWSLHAGVGVQIGITDRFYIRPDARGRWFDADDDSSFDEDEQDQIDWEASVAIGWYLGENVGASD